MPEYIADTRHGTVEQKVAEADLRQFVESALCHCSMHPQDAARAADVVVEADLRGVDTHGLRALAPRLTDMLAGRIDATATATLISTVGAIAQYDGNDGYGPLLCSVVATATADLAARHGIAMSLLRRSSHWGCPAYYSRAMAKRGCIGLAFTNTSPAMPLWGSSAKSVGNNPLTIAAPLRDGEPIVLDIAMQQISWGGLQLAAEEGRRLPGHWGYDQHGNETNDPRQIIQSGRVRPMGDHKGSGLAFMIEILTGVLSAGGTSRDIGLNTKRGAPAGYSQTFIAIDPGLVDANGGYFDRLAAIYAAAKCTPPAQGADPIALPGDRSNIMLLERRKNGIPLSRIRDAASRIVGQFGLAQPNWLPPCTP